MGFVPRGTLVRPGRDVSRVENLATECLCLRKLVRLLSSCVIIFGPLTIACVMILDASCFYNERWAHRIYLYISVS